MNFNTSPIAFFPSRAAQIWRAWFAQRKISVICGADLLPFYIIDNGSAPAGGELYDPNTDTKIADIDFAGHLLDHDITVDGQSRHVWIYQGEMSGVFGNTNPGYYYLKIGSWYSDVFRIGALSSEYTEISWQFFDDIITADGTPISKHIKYKQIFETPLWHPTYNVEEEGKTNNGIFFAMSQTTKKTSGFNAIVNESQLDCLNLTRMADMITIKACLNGTTKTMQTNQFEISSKWESDDVASIECQFDLFSIIRKYQQSNVEPEPLPIPTPPPPPSNYIIKGTATGSNVQFYINDTLTTLTVSNGEFYYAYDTPLTMFANVSMYSTPQDLTPKATNVTSLDFSQSCGMREALEFCLFKMESLTSINLAGCTFEKVTGAAHFIRGSKLTTLSAPDATFAALPEFPTYNGVTLMGTTDFLGTNSLLTSISMPNAVISARASYMFENNYELTSISMPLSEFDTATTAKYMFGGCRKLTSINMPIATFASVKRADYMFYDSGVDNSTLDFGTLFPSSAMALANGGADGMFYDSNYKTIDVSAIDFTACTSLYQTFKNCTKLKTISMTSGQLENVTDFEEAFAGCSSMANGISTLLSGETLASVTKTKKMFYECAGTLSLTTPTFANVTNAESMFEGSTMTSIAMAAATFASLTNGKRMFYNSQAVTSIDMSAATFENVTDVSNIFNSCNALTTLSLPTAEKMPKSISFAQSASLSVSSFSALSQWVKDLSGGSAQTLTVNSSAYNDWRVNHYATYNVAATRFTSKNWTVQH